MQKEYSVYLALSQYLRLQYPLVLYRFDLAGNNLSKAAAGKDRAIQKSRGYPDLFIMEPRGGFAGLFIEVKAAGVKISKRDGTFASPHILKQTGYLLRLTQRGYSAEFGVGFDACKKLIDEYLSLPVCKLEKP